MGLSTIALIGTLLFFTAWSSLSDAQQADRVYRVGYLSTGPGIGTRDEAYGQALRDVGYVEGKNLVIEWLFARKEQKPVSALAHQLVSLEVDVVFATSMRAARAAKKATSKIPIVFSSSPDPVAVGLIDNLAQPGGNLTGVTHFSTVLAGKRLELLKAILPDLSRVAVLWHPGNPGSERIWKETRLRAPELGLQLDSMAVKNASQFEGAFQEATKAGSDALAVTLSALINSNRERIVELARKRTIPAIYADSRFVRAGGLMSYATDRFEQDRRAASYLDKILKGAKPADLPVQQPTKFDFVVNLKTAQQLGMTIPSSILYRADKVLR